jgi:rhamnosyltransferase subunit B
VMDLYVPRKTLVVASSMALGARVAQDKAGVPVVTLHLQPAVFPSLYETPSFGGRDWLTKLPRPLKKVLFGLAYRWIDHILAGLNAFRASVGLGPVRGILQSWIHSPLRVIGLFPEWFAAPQPDWPPQTRLTGFPLYDGTGVQPVPPEVERFFASGPPPVIFTLGSAMRHARRMFEISAEACRRLGCRGLFMNQFPDQIPENLPETILAIPYAPFSKLFPRAAVIVHHGGIGTTAQSLAAGVPQLVTPFAHDQFDNAARVVRLGVGEELYAQRYTLPRLLEKLERLMKDPGRQAKARELKSRLDGPAAIQQTCDLILSAYQEIPSPSTR